MPSCTESGEVFPDFRETATLEANQPYFTQDGVFIHELLYYRPEYYCVDGELDSYEYREEIVEEEEETGGDELPYLKVQLCEEQGGSMGGCVGDRETCYAR